VGQALDRLARGRTTFLITHDLEHAAGSDLILFLEQGRVVERGTHKALLQANGRYAAMYRSQQVARQSFVPMEATHAFAR
jgi:ATP-binding cassette subfamily B protein